MTPSNLSFNLLRVLLVPILMWLGFVIYGYSLDFFTTLIPIPEHRALIYGAFMAQAFLASAVVSIVFSHAIAWLYRRFALVVAVLVALPVLALILPELFDSSRHPFALVIAGYNVLAYTVLVIVGVWVAQQQLLKTKAVMDSAC